MSEKMRWLPLESNPDVMNKYVQSLGLSKEWAFCDVFGFEPDLLLMVPRPVVAVMLLYPITEKSESEPLGCFKDGEDLYFMKQTIGNACGTIGIIHALCNNADTLCFNKEKHLSKFFNDTKDLSPAARGCCLEADTAFGEAHEESAQEGQTEAPDREKKVDLHFVAFVHKNGELFELDGRKDKPTCHGKTTADTLLEDAAQVVKKYMARDPENLNFSVVALGKA